MAEKVSLRKEETEEMLARPETPMPQEANEANGDGSTRRKFRLSFCRVQARVESLHYALSGEPKDF